MELQPLPNTWQSHTFRAMGSQILVWLDTPDPAVASEAFALAEACFATNEDALSRFRSDSELSRLNARSGDWVEVSDLLWSEITRAVQMAALTSGRFDPTLLKALEHAGYAQSFDMMVDSSQDGRQPNPALPGSQWALEQFPPGQWKAIEFDEDRQAVMVPEGVHLDLGGIAKGDTAQQVVEMIRVIGPCLVDAGGDLVAGEAPAGLPGWPVAISAPWTDSRNERADLATLLLAEATLATSGVDYRAWKREGQTMHHLIDPLTGEPAQTDGLTVTVLAGDASEAEAWATAALVAGSTSGMAALLRQKLAGLMITKRGCILVTPEMDQHLQGLSAPTP